MSARSALGRGFGGMLVLLLALAGGGLIAMSPDIALPMAILLLPGLFALVLDRSPGCGVARAILLFQGAACVHPLLSAWYRCAGVDGCMGYLAEWPSILPVWLAAGVAWILTQILPMGLKLLEDHRVRRRGADLLARRQALVEEWGLED
jgi:hypothetical protein